MFKQRATVSHIPQGRELGHARFHRHWRARGLVRVFPRRHGYALLVCKLSQVLSRVVVVQVVMMLEMLASLSRCRRLLLRGHGPPPIGRLC
jgi:hypothetical protein